MMAASDINTARLAHALGGGVMAGAWLSFAWLHVLGYERSGQLSYLLFCLSETLTALIFLVRTEPSSVSCAASDWLLAFAGTFAPLLLAPAETALLPAASLLVSAGCVLQMAGLLALNRSLGMVPARRVLKTGGLYRVVRHPLYAAYLLTFSGYLLSNSSLRNALLFVATLILLQLRMVREERHLALHQDYRSYMEQVKYRILPFVY